MIKNTKSIHQESFPSSCQLSVEFFHIFRGHAWSEGCWFLEPFLCYRVVTICGEAVHKERCRIRLTSRIISGKGPTALSPAGRTWIYVPRKLHWKSLCIPLGESFFIFFISWLCVEKKHLWKMENICHSTCSKPTGVMLLSSRFIYCLNNSGVLSSVLCKVLISGWWPKA